MGWLERPPGGKGDLPQRPDYGRVIYEALLRIEALLRDREPLANRAPRISGKAALSMRETSEALGLSLSKLKTLVQTDQIRAIRSGRRVLIPAESIDRFLRNER